MVLHESFYNSEEHTDVGNIVEGRAGFVPPSTIIGQYTHLFEHGYKSGVQLIADAEYAEGQRLEDSYETILSLRTSCESFTRLNAPRSASYCNYRIAREYFNAGDFNDAKQLFDGVAGLYRQEGWITLLWETLGYLKECSKKLGWEKDFIQYSLEMASLPIFCSSGVEALDDKRACGPAGPPTLSQRETVQQETFSLIKGYKRNSIEDQPISFDVDLMNPLRMAFLTSVTFHSQIMKPGSSALVTVSILSQLPHPVEINRLEIHFNQPGCNFNVVNDEEQFCKEVGVENHDTRLECFPSLMLTTNKWLRMTFEISSGKSGKLECLAINIFVGHRLTFCCRPESPASMDGLVLWKFENLLESFPTKDHIISLSCPKFLQVEEPEPQVELTLNASSPALVGENFIVPVSLVSKGHAVHSAELKINLVDARGGGMLMSPRDTEPFSLDKHHVELLSVSGVFEDESQSNSDEIKSIQQSFGVVSVPFVGVGQSWSCRLEIKWNRPKSIMLYVSLGYMSNTDGNSQRVNVHRSLQVEGKIPFAISHRFMMPFRTEPLLLSKLRTSRVDQMSLPLNQTSILIVAARNCSDISLRLSSMTIEPDGDQDAICSSCSVQPGARASSGSALIIPGEEYKQVFAVLPKVTSPNIEIGTVYMKWTRDSSSGQHPTIVLTKEKLPSVCVEAPPLIVSLDCPPHAILGLSFSLYIKTYNNTNLLQEIKFTLGDSQSFVFAGPHTDSVFILPKSEHVISYILLPLVSGLQHLPTVTVNSLRYTAAMNPSLAASAIFVYPTEPNLDVKRGSELFQTL